MALKYYYTRDKLQNEQNMIKLKAIPVKIAVIILPAMLINPAAVFAISKCQDASGKWHYGDNAASACGDAAITVIDARGRKVEEIAPPMTEDELLAMEAELKREEQELKQQAKRDLEKKRILAIYPREEDIILARDSRIQSMDKSIKLQEDLLDGMRLEMRELEARAVPQNEKAKARLEKRKIMQKESIDEYYQAITRLRREREKTLEKYEYILSEFRQLTAE
jgi:hypothetical protein